MVSTRNTSRSNANPTRMLNPPGGADSRPPGQLEAIQANTDEVEALRLVNQRLIEEIEQLTRQIQHPREMRQTQEGHDVPPPKGRHEHSIPRGIEAEAESSRTRGHGPRLAPVEEENEAVHRRRDEGEGPHHTPPATGEQAWEQRFRNLQQELSRVKEVIKGRAPDTMDTLVQQTESPFAPEVLRYPLPTKFRMPQLEAFDDTKDPVDHLNTYKNQMELHGYPDPVRCRAFATTLKGLAMAWFNRIPPSTISSFKELSIAFVSHFIGARTYRKPTYHLLTIKQGTQENLKSYVQRFNAESLKIDVLDEKFSVTAFIAGLGVQSKDLMFSITKNPQANMAEVLAKAEKYINGEEALMSKKENSSASKEKKTTEKRRGRSPKRQGDQRRSSGGERERSPKRRGNLRDRLGPSQSERRRRYSPQRFTPLTASVSQVLHEVQNEQFLRWPAQMKSNPATRDNSKYCEFHRDYGHRTDNCIQLRREIEYLIQRGYLRRFISPGNQAQSQTQNQNQAPAQPPPPRQTTIQHQQPLGEIHVISGGFAGGGESSSARKAHLRSIRSADMGEVQSVSKMPRVDTTITFSDSDLKGCQHPHDDPLVIRAIVANTTIHRVLVDNGSSADIIFASAFDKMGIGREKLEPVNTHLRGFSGEKVLPLGSVQLVLTLGEPPCQATTTARFLIVDAPSAYNMLLGRPSLNAIKAVPSAYHLVIKFPTVNGVGMVRGDQRVARECYTASMKQKAVDNVSIGELDIRDEVLTRPEPSEELEPVALDDDPEHLAYIGSKLAEGLKGPLTQFLRQNRDIFAWKQADMSGIDPTVITHKLNTNPSFKPVKQKRRSFAPERQKAINEEVGKLLQAGAIREVEYPEWLANVVLVKKANGKWRLCIDFTDINKACLKDSFPLPRIDLIVDATAGHELLSFMDAFSGYNQISMDPSDQEKTSFVTAQGTYCYRVMPFGLKNAGATYQRLVNRMFQKQIGTTMEVYIDDMLVKSTTADLHITHLSETFQILRNYNMKLNPAKCAFGVSAGKFLGFIVNHRGIEANPDKIKALLDMPSPTGIKEVQRLTGRIAALSRFVSRASDKCRPFFQVLKKAFQWDEKCEEAFAALKTYLSSPPILVSPTDGELLTLYLAVSDFSTSAVLVRDKEWVQHPVFYCSRALRGAEERYPKMEKLILALVTAARKLRPYFQAHTIEVPTEYPMKQVLHKPEVSGRLMKWAIELSEFDIRYKPKTAVKGQILADFVMEFAPVELAEPAQPRDDLPIWKLSVDGALNAQGSGAGLILTSPEGIDIDYALRFGFHASNNEAEYEAVIAGLNLAHSLEVDQLEVHSDSQLVVRQIEDTYEAKSEKMVLYLQKVRDLLKKFVSVQIKYVPRTENSRADALAKLATALQEDIGESTPIEYLAEPSIDPYGMMIAPVGSVPNWMDPIWDYINDGALPDDPKEAAKIRMRSSRFTNHKGSLYKRGFYTPFLKCIAGEDTEYVLREVHEGICGNHIEARTLAGKVLRQGYYWPTMLKDATDLVKRCRICQEHAKISRLPAEPLTSITSPWPFQQWGLDIMGPLPISKGQCKFIIVAVDYFTKWAEAEPLATITEQKIRNFV